MPKESRPRSEIDLDAQLEHAWRHVCVGLQPCRPVLLISISVFSHYSNVPRRPSRRAGDIRIVAREDLGAGRRLVRYAKRFSEKPEGSCYCRAT